MTAQKTKVLAIIGQGYVGLPLAMAAIDAGWTVIGVDNFESKVFQINTGKSPVEDVSDAQLKSALERGVYFASTDFSAVAKASVIAICVPTPLNDKREPDLSLLERAVKDIGPHISNETLVVSESTSYPGTLRDVIIPTINSMKPKECVDIYFASAPERVNPGDRVWNQRNTPRLVGAINDQSKKWDIVALQEMRGLPVAREGPDGYGFIFGRESRFVPYARKFHEEIQKQKAITMLFMTWKTPALNGLTQAEWTDSHLKLAKQLQTEVSPVGMAIEKVQLLNPQIALFDDLYPGHLNTNGVYICACAFYAALFHESPIGLPRVIIHPSNNNTTVTAANALIFQTAAWSAHQETQKRLRN